MATEPPVDRAIEALLSEQRTFPPPPAFAHQANISDRAVYERAERDPEGFWATFARELVWVRPWEKVLDWRPPKAKWFVGGKLNAAFNWLDRNPAKRGEKDQKAKLLVTADGGWRRGKVVELKKNADEALGSALSFR